MTLDNVLIDTGSAGTVIPVDIAIDRGLGPEWKDELIRIQGIGGTEFTQLSQQQTASRSLKNEGKLPIK